ncbi:division/cell wall cluster transcriptional repressor MraZ [Anianabacter salinae]|uniref:division/cell wall cluster transcriptional repressor MraZ n=1 Tax=Anianabacter salinae TaxID=2851023 RepID=UPI00225DE480|nr:division/cell wall cluster transcriptional repressor MraZ [Anianabacter salinae]MBV0914069.1 division/cell wall cluster transcriptional repressor MraZ [Anianabacter salinae]
MAQRFRGKHTQKVDGKGRVSIPVEFRRVLEANDPDWVEGKPAEMVVVYGLSFRGYLECYTMEAIVEIEAKIEAMPLGSTEREVMQELISSESLKASIDDTGRIVMPAWLREKVNIDGEAHFVATGKTFQVWNQAAYEAKMAKTVQAYLADKPENFNPLSLLEQ